MKPFHLLSLTALLALTACGTSSQSPGSQSPGSQSAEAQAPITTQAVRPTPGGNVLEPLQLGNIFLVGTTPEVRVNLDGNTVRWTLTDFRGNVAATGRDGMGDRRLRLRLPEGEQGFYTLRVETFRGEQPVASAVTTVGVLSQADFRRYEDSPFGMATHFGSFNEDGTLRWPLEQIPLLDLAGVRGVRDEIPWSKVEPLKGQYVFPPEYDQRMSMLEERGINHLTLLNYGNRLYDQDAEGIGAFPYTQEGRQGYANYAKALLARYPQIGEVEVWNEFNGGNAPWNRGPCKNVNPAPNPYAIQCYADTLKVVYDAIKSVRPDVNVTGPAGVTLPFGFLEQLFQKGALNHLDAVTVHPYIYPAAPEGANVVSLNNQLGALIRRYNAGQDKPVYFTEIGWPSHVPPRGVDEASQARFLVREHVLSLSSGIDKLFWYDFMNDGVEPDKQEQNFGLIRHFEDPRGAYTPKAGYMAYAAMTRQLTGATYQARETAPEGVQSHRFSGERGEVRVMWALTKPEASYFLKTVTLAAGGPVTVTDIMGETREYQPLNGQVFLTLSSDPVYVSGPVTGVTEGSPFTVAASTDRTRPVALRVDNAAGTGDLNVQFRLDGEAQPVTVTASVGQTAQATTNLSGDLGFRQAVADVLVDGARVGTLIATVNVTDPGVVLPFPANAVYGDSYPSPGTRGDTLGGDPPELDLSGQNVLYSGFGPGSFTVGPVARSNAVNDGNSGALTVSRADNSDVTLLLPIPARSFSAQVDLIPFTGQSPNASRQVGLILTKGAGENFFSQAGAVRIGIGGAQNEVLRVERRLGQSFTVPVTSLTNHAADNWNELRVDADLGTNSLKVFYNGTLAGEYTVDLTGVTHVGLEAISGGNVAGVTGTQSAHLDTFSVSPAGQ